MRLVVDAATGEVVQRLDYDAFGRTRLDTNPGDVGRCFGVRPQVLVGLF